MAARSAKALSASTASVPTPEPIRVRMSAEILGQAGSKETLARLDLALAEVRALAVAPILQRSVAALQNNDFKMGGELAIRALEIDEANGYGWYLLAIARERAGDFKTSLQAYEVALERMPDQAMVANDLGRLAYRMGMLEVATKLFAHFMAGHPEVPEAANNLACALRDLGRYGEAIEVLRPAILKTPDDWSLWNTMGTIVGEQGDPAGSVVFFDEALRLEPKDAYKARYNRGNARLALGEIDDALRDCEAALSHPMSPPDLAMMRLARSTILLGQGRIKDAWEDYEARLDPQFAEMVHFLTERPLWTPEEDLAGKTLAVFGEQGLGDEVLFGSLLPDVIEALGPRGKLILAVEQRLVPLFERAFPTAQVGPHLSAAVDGRTVRGAPFIENWDAVDCWTPIASLSRRFRTELSAFPEENLFLRPDPAQVDHWRGELAKLGSAPKIGLLWKSLKLDAARFRFFSPFEQWRSVLTTPGVRFVNLQYGETEPELAHARRMGVDIWTPPDLDLKNDLDGVAALSCALDLVVAPSNATTNIAAACGAPVWLITAPGSWPRLGTERYPWYPTARNFTPRAYGAWSEVMDEVAGALADWRG